MLVEIRNVFTKEVTFQFSRMNRSLSRKVVEDLGDERDSKDNV